MAAMLTGVTWEMAEQRQSPKASKRLLAAIATVALVFVVALCFLPRPKAKEVNRLDEMKRTQQKLQEAIAADDPILMAEALLDHARQKIHLSPSPMEALRHGNLKEAWARADEFESKRRALWYLLMAWHLKAEGKDEWARKTLQRLLNSSIPSFAAEVENPLHLILLSEVAKMDWQIFDALSRRMLDTFQQALLVKHLLASNNLDGAFRLVQELKRPEDYYEERSVDEAISDVAVALAQVGRFDEALQLARRRMRSIGGRLRSPGSGQGGAASEIPPFWCMRPNPAPQGTVPGGKKSSNEMFKEQGEAALDFYTKIKTVYLSF
jgi:Flp pilus assembly protein TadD